METYVDIYLHADGTEASIIYKRILALGLKPTFGEHDFIYNWKGIVNIEEELKFIDKIQSELKGTGAILRFITIR